MLTREASNHINPSYSLVADDDVKKAKNHINPSYSLVADDVKKADNHINPSISILFSINLTAVRISMYFTLY